MDPQAFGENVTTEVIDIFGSVTDDWRVEYMVMALHTYIVDASSRLYYLRLLIVQYKVGVKHPPEEKTSSPFGMMRLEKNV